MFAPVSFQDISFPQTAVMGDLDMISEAYGAWNQYSNQPTSSTFSTSSYFTTSLSGSGAAIGRFGLAPNDRIFSIFENGTTGYIWDTNTNTEIGTVSLTNPGTIRKVVYDNLTNSWIVCGRNNFIKVNCVTTASTNIPVPSNVGTEYASVVAYNGKAYALPYVSVTANTAVAVFDLVANTASTGSARPGVTGGYWGATLTSLGTIYFFKEVGGTNNSIYEYNPTTGTGTLFGTLSGNSGYLVSNLPDGRVISQGLTTEANSFIINPNNKAIATISKGGIPAGSTGICVGQDGKVWTVRSSPAPADSTLYYFNPVNNVQTSLSGSLLLQRPTSGDRGFQDLIQLSDGRIAIMPGQNNSGRLVYFNYLANRSANNGYTSAGMANPIMTTGQGT